MEPVDKLNRLLDSWTDVTNDVAKSARSVKKMTPLSESILLKKEEDGTFSFADKMAVRKNLPARMKLLREKKMYTFSKNITTLKSSFTELIGNLKPADLKDGALSNKIKNFVISYNNFLEKAAQKKAHSEIRFARIRKFFNTTSYRKALNEKIATFLKQQIDLKQVESILNRNKDNSEIAKIQEFREKIAAITPYDESDENFKKILIQHIDQTLQNTTIQPMLSQVKKELKQIILNECASKTHPEIWTLLVKEKRAMYKIIYDLNLTTSDTKHLEKMLCEKVKFLWPKHELELESFLRNVPGLSKELLSTLSREAMNEKNFSIAIRDCITKMTSPDLKIIVLALKQSKNKDLQEYFFKWVQKNWKSKCTSSIWIPNTKVRTQFYEKICDCTSIDDLLKNSTLHEASQAPSK